MLAKVNQLVDKAINASHEKLMHLPDPFLQRPLPDAPVESGWKYTEAEARLNGLANHGAIDFAAPRGTPVLAAADGYAMASWQEAPVFIDGQRHTFQGEPTWFGAGLFVQIWHGHGRYTQYCHLEEMAEEIPFFDPKAYLERGVDAWSPHPIIRGDVREYQKLPRVKAGQVIGYVGMTGCPAGRPSFPDWDAGLPYATMHPFHLHFVVFGRRAPHTRNAQRWDPFGIYGTYDHYPAANADWTKPGSNHHSLWLE